VWQVYACKKSVWYVGMKYSGFEDSAHVLPLFLLPPMPAVRQITSRRPEEFNA